MRCRLGIPTKRSDGSAAICVIPQAKHNLERVQYRAELQANRDRIRAEQLDRERLIGEEHALRERRTRDAVLALLNVSADPERMTGHTLASQAEAISKVELFPVHGYADATLMRDMRFKLGHALRNAGLQGSEYARQILCDPRRFGGARRPEVWTSNVPLVHTT